jgi:choline-sulfatase
VSRRAKGTIAILLALAAAAGILRLRRPRDPEAAARARLARLDPRPAAVNVVLVTLDTLRADRLGCYGFRGVETPHLDALARDGVLFEQATATVPLTLPSHASILTGLLPPRHGVRDNGGFFLDEARTTLAERFRAKGYATAGFVGAWVLESRWGLAQGFDTYSDHFGRDQLQRRGDEVVGDALAWIDSVRDRKFFAWVHLYDPHLPYDPPEPYRSRYAGQPYLGELAFTDAQVGRLVARLRERGLLDRTVVVVTADHGEGLGDHGEPNHGLFVYDSTVAVPLLIRTPWGNKGRSRTQTSGADLFPTLLDLAGLGPEAGIDGRSLLPAVLDPQADLGHVAYSETYFPRYHYGWQQLRALRDGARKFIEAPRPELYDLAADPGETRSLYKDYDKAADDMRVALGRLGGGTAAPPERRGLDEETRQRLAALGYVGSAAAADPAAVLPDPKDKVHLFADLESAKQAAEEGRLDEAIATGRRVVAADPEIMDARLTLGGWLVKARRTSEAIPEFQRALALKPDDEVAVVRLVSACVAAGQPAEARAALQAFRAGLEANPGNPQGWYQLGALSLQLGQRADAEAAFTRARDANPGLAAAHNALGALALDRGELDRAEAAIRKAIALEADVPTARYNLARILEARGAAPEAEAMYRAELADDPAHGRAHFNLARLLQKKGDEAGYVAELRRGVEQAPRSGPCFFLLAREEMKAGRLAAAADLARRGLEVDQTSEIAPLGYFVLADVYTRQGQKARAAEALASGRRLQGAVRSPGPPL